MHGSYFKFLLSTSNMNKVKIHTVHYSMCMCVTGMVSFAKKCMMKIYSHVLKKHTFMFTQPLEFLYKLSLILLNKITILCKTDLLQQV